MEQQWFEASAPGRLDVMGGIADYSGSLVLQMPIKESTHVKLRLRNDFQCSIQSTVDGITFEATLDYRSMLNNGRPDLTFAQQFFQNNSTISWTAYVLGCVLVLHHENKIQFTGADFEITSSVPLGKGVSSSASIEVAVMKAIQKAFQLHFAGTELPRLAQQAENLVVGAPCGLMDQLASFFGEPQKLLPIICQPDILKSVISVPSDIHFIGIDSGVRHSVGGASYIDVRCAAFMGYSIIANECGVSVKELSSEKIERESLPFKGYLANITIGQYEREFRNILPEKMNGGDFISKYGDTIDPVTKVNPNVSYAIRACASHPIYENARVNSFMTVIERLHVSLTLENIKLLGEFMNQSHESYSACGLGSDRTDEIVEEFKKFPSVAGSKITGGGSGGTVCALAIGNEGINDVLRVHSHFSKKYRTPLRVFK
jgi:galactokinase